MMLRAALLLILSIGAVFGDDDETGCGNNPADIVFVLDESGSIWGPHFKRQLEFVQKIIGSFDVGFNRTHIGVMTFGTDNRIIFQLGKYTTKEDLKAAVKAIQQRRGETYTHLALKRMGDEMFSRTFSRPWVRRVAIIITDGESNYPKETKEEAAKIHQKNIEVLAVGIGTAVARSELDAIASDPDHVHMVDSYEALESLRRTLAWQACEPPTTPAPPTPEPIQMIQGCRGEKQMDHIWSISDQAGVEETDLALEFIKSTTEDMTIDPGHIQIGIAPKFCDEGLAIRLKDHDTKAGFLKNLAKRRLVGLRLERTLEYIREEGITASNGGRSDAVKFGILIIDNQPEDWEKTLREAVIAKDSGVRLIVIGVGSRVNSDKLRELASTDGDYFFAEDYAGLADLKSSLIQAFCKGIEGIHFSGKRLFEEFWEK